MTFSFILAKHNVSNTLGNIQLASTKYRAPKSLCKQRNAINNIELRGMLFVLLRELLSKTAKKKKRKRIFKNFLNDFYFFRQSWFTVFRQLSTVQQRPSHTYTYTFFFSHPPSGSIIIDQRVPIVIQQDLIAYPFQKKKEKKDI